MKLSDKYFCPICFDLNTYALLKSGTWLIASGVKLNPLVLQFNYITVNLPHHSRHLENIEGFCLVSAVLSLVEGRKGKKGIRNYIEDKIIETN